MGKNDRDVEPLPRPDEEAPADAPDDLVLDAAAALQRRFAEHLAEGERVLLEARTGRDAAWLGAAVGAKRRVHQIELFARGVEGALLDGALGLLLDYLEGLLEEIFASGRESFLPLDWTGRDYEGAAVWARGEIRDYLAEDEAGKLLGEEPPRRFGASDPDT